MTIAQWKDGEREEAVWIPFQGWRNSDVEWDSSKVTKDQGEEILSFPS